MSATWARAAQVGMRKAAPTSVETIGTLTRALIRDSSSRDPPSSSSQHDPDSSILPRSGDFIAFASLVQAARTREAPVRPGPLWEPGPPRGLLSLRKQGPGAPAGSPDVRATAYL